MILQLLSVLAVQPASLPEDAVSRYSLCVARMAAARDGSDPNDASASISAVACENLLPAAVEQVRQAASGASADANHRIGALLELNARREAVARNAISRSYQEQKR